MERRLTLRDKDGDLNVGYDDLLKYCTRANVVAAEVIFSFHLSRFLFYPLRTALNTPAGFIVFKFTDEAIRFFSGFLLYLLSP